MKVVLITYSSRCAVGLHKILEILTRAGTYLAPF